MLLSFKQKYSIIPMWEPRYHDLVVLVAARKVAEHNKVIIRHPKKETPGAYDGTYYLAGVVATACKLGTNGKIPCYEVPISFLEREN